MTESANECPTCGNWTRTNRKLNGCDSRGNMDWCADPWHDSAAPAAPPDEASPHVATLDYQFREWAVKRWPEMDFTRVHDGFDSGFTEGVYVMWRDYVRAGPSVRPEEEERRLAEDAYTISAFDYLRDPVGSRDWTLYWKGWLARAAVTPGALWLCYHALKQIEWRSWDEWDNRICPCCEKLQTEGHQKDCMVGKALEAVTRNGQGGVMNHKDADTPDELTRWIWDKYVGVPVAGGVWGQEYENLLDRVRRMDRSSFTKGLHEGARQMKSLTRTEGK